jgi:hypothetical protein
VNADADKPLTPARRRRYYSADLNPEERGAYEEALTMDGLEEEIAILRVRIKEASDAHPGDLRLLTHGISVLARTLAVQYRLSPKARNDLADNLAAALNSLGDQLLPADSP